METENKEKQDCGCDSDCCTPKKKSPIIKILFILIIVGALGIASAKLFSDNKEKPIVTKEQSDSLPPCCASKKVTTCDTAAKTSCCPQAVK